MDGWGVDLLHRLAQRREVVIFDNIDQGLSEEVVPEGEEPPSHPITPSMLEEASASIHCFSERTFLELLGKGFQTTCLGLMCSVANRTCAQLLSHLPSYLVLNALAPPSALVPARLAASCLGTLPSKLSHILHSFLTRPPARFALPPHSQVTMSFLDAINLTRPHVAGWSLGGAAALKLAAHQPERVNKVGSCGAAELKTAGATAALQRRFG